MIVASISQIDFLITSEKLENCNQQIGKVGRGPHNITGLVVCPMCERVFSSSQWSEHRYKELNRRSSSPKPVFKGKDGKYRCVVLGCPYTGTSDFKTFKNHLAIHDLKALQDTGFPLEVIIFSFFSFLPCRT